MTPDVTARSISDLLSLKGRTAVVTGGGRGIGLAIATRLAEAGANVLIGDLNVPNATEAAARLQQRFGVQARARALNVSDAASVRQLAAAAVDQWGRLDIWVNNAGIYPFVAALELTEADWDRLMHINLRGGFVGCQEAAKHMVQAGRPGVIINILSTAAFHTAGNSAHYVASKHGLAGFTKAFAKELGPHHIRVLAVAPTLVATPGVSEAKQGAHQLEEALDAFAKSLPAGRAALPDDIARVVLFCAADLSLFVNGAILPVDGGEMAL